MTLGRLPAGLAEPLHFDSPFPWTLVKILAGVLVALLLLALVRRWLRRRRQAPSRPLPAPVPAAEPGLREAIESIRRRYRGGHAYRDACHELSSLLRRAFEHNTRRSYSTLTAGEIQRQVGDSRVARFFAFLAELQFGRRRPSGNDLDGACDLALDVAREELS